MKHWFKVLLGAGLVCAVFPGARVWGCHVEGETCRVDQPGQPWVAMTPSGEYSNCDECNAAIQEAYEKYRRYYRDLHCVDCDCGPGGGNDNASAAPSQDTSVFDEQRKSGEADQRAAEENEHQANLAKQQKFNEDKQDALSQLKGIAGENEEGAGDAGDEPVSKQTRGRQEKAKHHSGGGWDRPSKGPLPKVTGIPPVPSPVPDITLQGLKKEVKRYKTELEKKKKKIQEINVKITQLAVRQNETAPPEPANDPPTPTPGSPIREPARPTPTAGKAAQELDDLNELRRKAMADEADLENKISDSEKKIDEMSKPTPAP